MSTTKPRRATQAKTIAPRILVLRAPGTNCDRETAFAFEAAGATTQALHLNALLAKPGALARAQGLVIPGGFSFGDDLGAGTVLATALRTRLRDPMRRLVDRGGVVLGICNGFQVLARTGLLPGFDAETQGTLGTDGEDRLVSLASNIQNRYEDRWVALEAISGSCVFFRKGDRIACPVAHAEGRFLPRDEAVHRALIAGDQIALRYVVPDGEPKTSGVPYPYNPNGAHDNIAGICDTTGRVLGMMPHPERNQFRWQDPRFHQGTAPRRPEGLRPFERAVTYLRSQM